MFYRPKHSKSPSAKIKRKIIFLFTLVAAAVVCYSVTVYAYFQATVLNSGNTIRVGSYAAKIEILAEDKTLLWSSDEEILGYGADISLSSEAVPAILRITNTGALAFQYQVGLKNGDVFLLYKDKNEAGDKLVLQPGQDLDYPLEQAASVSTLRLDFRTAFQNGELQDPIEPPAHTAVGAPAAVESQPAIEPQQDALPVESAAPSAPSVPSALSSSQPSSVSEEPGGVSSRDAEGTVSLPETSLPVPAEDVSSEEASSVPAVSSQPETASYDTSSSDNMK